MDLLIFSNNRNIKTFFTKIEKNKNYNVIFHSCDQLKKAVKGHNSTGLIFYDFSPFDEKEQLKILNYFSKLESYNYIVLDSKNSVKDIALLFHKGCSDYIGKTLFKEGLTIKRINNLLKYRSLTSTPSNAVKKDTDGDSSIEKKDRSSKKTISKAKEQRLSGLDWKNIKSGTEYTFAFLFIELDNFNSIKNELGSEETKNFMNSFHHHLEDLPEAMGGKIWMWIESGGLLIFPFDGKTTNALQAGLDIFLNSKILNIPPYSKSISLRVAVHIGNTVYKSRGNTGTIVSDSVNSIFHIGQKFAQKDSLYITEEYHSLIPEKLKKYLVSDGVFEDREIYRLKSIASNK